MLTEVLLQNVYPVAFEERSRAKASSQQAFINVCEFRMSSRQGWNGSMFACKPFLLYYRPLGSDVHRNFVTKGLPNGIPRAIESSSLSPTNFYKRARILLAKRTKLERLYVCMQAGFTVLLASVVRCSPIFATKNFPLGIPRAIESPSFSGTSLHTRAQILKAKFTNLERLYVCMLAVFTLLLASVVGCSSILVTEGFANGIPGAIASLSFT